MNGLYTNYDCDAGDRKIALRNLYSRDRERTSLDNFLPSKIDVAEISWSIDNKQKQGTLIDSIPTVNVDYAPSVIRSPVLDAYVKQLTSTVVREGVSVDKIHVYIPEGIESPNEIVFAIYVNAPSHIALPFWKKLDADVDTWLVDQPKDVMETVLVQFSTAVRWK